VPDTREGCRALAGAGAARRCCATIRPIRPPCQNKHLEGMAVTHECRKGMPRCHPGLTDQRDPRTFCRARISMAFALLNFSRMSWPNLLRTGRLHRSRVLLGCCALAHVVLAQAVTPSNIPPVTVPSLGSPGAPGSPATVPSLGSPGAPPQPATVPSLGSPGAPPPPASVPSLGSSGAPPPPASVPSVGTTGPVQPGSVPSLGTATEGSQPAVVPSQR
jgi:hypothetical protein